MGENGWETGDPLADFRRMANEYATGVIGKAPHPALAVLAYRQAKAALAFIAEMQMDTLKTIMEEMKDEEEDG